MKRLAGKKAVVTGGTRGIGFAISQIFVAQGAHVIAVGTNSERGAKAVELLIEHKVVDNQTIEFRSVNVADHNAVAVFGKEIIEMWGEIDIVVNCAGITRDSLMIKIKEDDWDSVLDVNLKSVYNTIHAFLRTMMKKRSGRIINISSVVGQIGSPGQVSYAASKAGMVGLTKSLAKEVASRKITVNCIAPGFIETEMTEKLTDAQKESIMKQVPMGRLGSTREIAFAALFLASDEAEYITGQVFTVDGGMTA